MNISNSRESDKEEDTNGKKLTSNPTLTTSSWTRLKDPRIVRVSRAFGGKDRHSKVCTVRGLRDRRVRLSVPTAIQLYDLQDRLGLNQPSKVVDWLLDVAKNEIDGLPPLQMPSGNFGQFGLQSMVNLASQSENLEGVKASNSGTLSWEDYWKGNHSSTHSSSSSVMFNNIEPNGSLLKLNPSNLSVSQLGSYGLMAPHQENTSHNFNINMSGSQFVVYPPPSHDHNSRDQYDPKQLNFEMLSSSSSSSHHPLSSSPLYTLNQGMVRPFHLCLNPKPFPSEENEADDGH